MVLLSLKLLIFSLIITHFGTLRIQQIAPFISNFSGGACPTTPYHKPESTSLQGYLRACYVILSVFNYLIFIKTLTNADQIYTYLMILKLDMRIWPRFLIAIIKKTFYGYKNKFFNSLCLKKIQVKQHQSTTNEITLSPKQFFH